MANSWNGTSRLRRPLLTLGLAGLLLGTPVGPARAGAPEALPNRAEEYAPGQRPWLACALEQAFEVDFEGTDRPYHVEWRRCGPKEARWKPDRRGLEYPVHYVTVQRNPGAGRPLVVFDNDGEPELSYIASLRRLRLAGDRTEQLAVVTEYYGTGHVWALCALGWVGGKLDCWAEPDYRPALRRLMREDEEHWKVLLRALSDTGLLIEALIYDKARDPNCCPSRGSIFLELLPRAGRFEIGRAWRTPPREPR